MSNQTAEDKLALIEVAMVEAIDDLSNDAIESYEAKRRVMKCMESYHQSRLQSLKEEVEDLRDIASDLQKEYEGGELVHKYQYWRGREHVADEILILIEKHLQQ